MKPRKKRKPDFRRVRPSRTYSIAEFADAIQRSTATVRSWIAKGMPTIDQLKPTVIDGALAKEWIRNEWTMRKHSSGPDQAHCLRCRKPSRFAEGSRSMAHVTAKVLAISGKCAVCGCRMNKFASARSVAILDVFKERKRDNNAA